MASADDIQELNIQEIQCSGTDAHTSHPVYGTNVLIKAGKQNLTESNTASNKVKVSQISKFDWEEKYYLGNLVSCNHTYIAYVLRAKDNLDDHVRVINHHTSSRVLLRGLKRKVVDINFESFQSNQLACIDAEGRLCVFDIFETEGNVKSKVVLQVNREGITNDTSLRVVWTPNIVPPVETHEPLVAISLGANVEVFHLQKILDAHPGECEINRKDINEGVITLFDCHKKDITSLAVSPDTQVIATCSLDGDVKFWGLNFDDEKSAPSCLHEWEPHGGEPVTSLFFCDNLLVGDDTSPFWRYLITGTTQNSTLKVWCAVKWDCIQTIRFAPYADSPNSPLPCLKAALDISAKYFILCDIHRQVLYICQFHQDAEKEKSSVVAISEFVLKEPLLSFSICVAKERKGRSSSEEQDTDLLTSGDDYPDDSIGEKEENRINLSVVNLFAISRRALQKLSIKFEANTSIQQHPAPSISTADDELLSIRDALSDIDSTENISERGHSTGSIESDDDLVSSHTNLSTSSSLTAVSTNIMSSVTPTEKLDDDMLINISQSSNENIPPIQSVSVLIPELEKLSFDTSTLNSSENLVNGTLPNDEKSPLSSKPFCPIFQSHEEGTRNVLHTTSQFNHASTAIAMKPVHASTADMNQVLSVLSKQQSIIDSQQQELREMKDMLKILVKRQSDTTVNSSREQIEHERDELKVHMQLLQKSATSQFSKASKEFNKLCSQRLHQFTQDLTANVQAKEEHTIQVLSNMVSNTIALKLEKTVKSEMKQTILSGLEKVQNKHMDVLTNQIAQKLSIWERTLREESQELIKSKPLAESIGYAAASILEGTIPAAYRESFQNVLLPGFEKASMAMFMQINQTFQQGTKQYLERLESHLDSKRQKQLDLQDPLIASLQDLVNSFQGTADRLTSGVETNLEALMQKQLRDATDRMQNTFGKTIESRIIPSLSKSISKCADDAFSEWKAKIDESFTSILQSSNSGALQMNDVEDGEAKRKRVNALILSENYNRAFEEALTASDLSLVMDVCKQVDTTEMFQSENKFPQPIILSLIQQLSVNLNDETETKTRYLEESIMALDTDDEITREHMPGVLQCLNDQLTSTIDAFIKGDPGSKQIKPLKMLLMASRSLLHGG